MKKQTTEPTPCDESAHTERTASASLRLLKMLKEWQLNKAAGHLASDLITWKNILPSLANTDAERLEFWHRFNDHEKTKERVSAHVGLVAARTGEARGFVTRLRINAESRAYGIDDEDKASGALAGHIAKEITDAYEANDVAFFKDIARTLESHGTENVSTMKGGQYSEKGSVWREFCSLLLVNEKLPNKAELREICGINGDQSAERAFRRTLSALGLGGLPERDR